MQAFATQVTPSSEKQPLLSSPDHTLTQALHRPKTVTTRGIPQGGCPRIESLLRKSGFWPIFPIKFVKYSKYSPHLIEKMDSKPLSLATASILGQPPIKGPIAPKRAIPQARLIP